MSRKIVYLLLIIGVVGVMPTFGEVVINEIMYHPSSDDLNAEYIELFNSDSNPVDIAGWQFKNGIEFTFPQGAIIEANGYLLLCRNELFVRAQYNLGGTVNTIGNYAPTKLSNSGEDIALYDQFDQKVDEVEYSDNAPWPKLADGDGASLELVHPQVDNNNILYWKASLKPSPGKANSQLTQNTPPQIISIKHIPQSPSDQDAVTIEALFEQGVTINIVTLSYSVNGAAAKTLSMTKQGDRFAAILPAQSEATVVDYSIIASNSDGYQINAPSGPGEGRFLYKVDNAPHFPGSVLINEFQIGYPYDDSVNYDEWIELFNPTNQSIDLSDWLIKDSNDSNFFRILQGTVIPAKGYLVFSQKTDGGLNTFGDLPFSLNDQGDQIRLFDPNGHLITQVEYSDNSEWPNLVEGMISSYELVDPSRPNNQPNNWAVAPMGSKGKENIRKITDANYHDYDVIINEVLYHPEDEEYDNNLDKEYVELFNQGATAVDVSGWRFTEGINFIIPAGTIIPAKGYLLICRNVNQYPEVQNKVGNFTLQLNNAGESIALTNNINQDDPDLNIVIDYVQFNDTFPWPIRPDGDGNSLELITPNGDNRDAHNWRSGQKNSPGAPNSQITTNEPPRITKVNHTPDKLTASTSEQQTESKLLIDMEEQWKYFKGNQAPPSNWNAVDFDDASWDEGQAGFGYDDDDDNTIINDMQNRYLSLYIRKTFTLDSVEGFALLALGVDYDDSFIAYLNGVEIARSNVSGNPPSFDDESDGNHEAGTMEEFDVTSFIKNLRPGKNVLAVQGHNTSLTSSDFSLHPALAMMRVLDAGEDDADAITITAKAVDEDGIDTVTLHYQRLSSPYGTGLVMGEWKSVNMFDNGTSGDNIADDGVYSYKLNNAETIRPHEIWRYKITATDKAGQVATIPRQEEKTQALAFFVEDRLDPPKYPTIYLFAEQEVLNWLNRNVQSDVEQPSFVVIEGEVFDLSNSGGIRYRGNTLRNKPKKSWKIQFAKDHRWNNRRTYNLNANYQTSPLLRGESGFQEHLAYQFMQQAGVPASDSKHYRVVLNNAYYGLFIGLEQYNEDFLDAHDMPAETQLYKAGIKARRSYLTKEPNFDAYAQKYENAIGRADDIAVLINFIEELNDSSDLKSFFESNVNIETYLNYLASVAVLSHVDSTEKNYFPSRGADQLWYISPWDMSHAWGEIHTSDSFPLISNYSLLDGAVGGVFGTNELRKRFLGVPEFRDRYYQRLRYFVEHIFTHEHLDPIFDSYWSYLEDAIRENMERWNSPGQIDDMISEMKKYITARREFILKDKNVRAADTSNAPENVLPANHAVLTSRIVELQAVTAFSSPLVMQWEINQNNDDFYKPIWSSQNKVDAPSIKVPAYIIGAGTTYFWRARYQRNDGLWSDWSQPTSFSLNPGLAPPDVENVIVTPMNESLRIQWSQPTAADLIRVDIFEDNEIIESTPITDNRIRIRDLKNGQLYTFVIRTISENRLSSKGVVVQGSPVGDIAEGNVIAYYRFEGDAKESIGLFPDGQLLGSTSIAAPGANSEVPLTEQPNTTALVLDGVDGNGFQFGSTESYLDVEQSMTIECYAMFSLNSFGEAILVDRYDEANASVDGVWRFAAGLSETGSLDFLLNDASANSGFNERLHTATSGGAVIYDGLFHHYAAVVNLKNTMQPVLLYVDGNKVEAQITHYEDGLAYDKLRTDSDLPIMVGARRTAAGTTDVLPGRIDEVRLSAGALTPDQFLNGPDITAVSDWALY